MQKEPNRAEAVHPSSTQSLTEERSHAYVTSVVLQMHCLKLSSFFFFTPEKTMESGFKYTYVLLLNSVANLKWNGHG